MKGRSIAGEVAQRLSLQSSRRVFWSSLEAFTWPALWLLATPWFVDVLGHERFGLLMFVNAMAIVAAFSGLGLGASVLKHVAHQSGSGTSPEAADYVRAALTIGVCAGLALTALTVAASGSLAAHLFTRLGAVDDVAVLIVLGVVTVGIQQLDQVVASGLKGVERFDLSALVDFASKSSALGLMMVVAVRTGDVPKVVLAQQACFAIGAVAKAGLLGGLLGRTVFRLSVDRARIAEVFNFGKWVWLQSVSGVITFALDRLVVASLFGPAVLAAYTICHLAAQVMHNFVSACFQPVFPRISALAARGEGAAVRALVRRVLAANVALVVGICAGLLAFTNAILTLWMGREFAAEYESLFRIFIVANGLMGLNVAAYYTLLGLGESRVVATFSAVGGAASVLCLVLVAPLGVLYAAAARGPYVIASLGLVAVAHRRVHSR
jgi:O-antigen/teichoic acid export membrane protein